MALVALLSPAGAQTVPATEEPAKRQPEPAQEPTSDPAHAAPDAEPASDAERGAAGLVPETRPPELLEFVPAEYPAEALQAGREGSVVLRLTIDATGGVTEAQVIESLGFGLDEAASAAALKFRFAPAHHAGAAVASRILYRYEFRAPARAPSENLPPAAAAVPLAALTSPAPPAPLTPTIEVSVQGESQAQRLRESAQAVTVIDTEVAQRHSGDLGALLARTEGVAVQRSGGLGSDTRLSLNGLTDDQIRVFLDGVPIEFSGFGLGISHVPLSWVERIDVYRGVVPVRFGADALGGAVDLITDQPLSGPTVQTSYTTGAFDTHQLGLSARQYQESTGLFTRLAAFYDTTLNDYLVDVEVPDQRGRPRPARVRRFHDGYRAGGGNVELGFVDRPWAKRFLLRVFATDFDKDLQHNSNMTVPYGGVEYGQTSVGGTLRYEEPRIGGSRFSTTALAGYAHRVLDFTDTSRWVYDWFGNRVFERAARAGEIGAFASELTQREHRALGRFTLSHDFARGQLLRLAIAPDYITRTGREERRVNPDRRDPLTTERTIVELVSGLEYLLHAAEGRVENSAFFKHYYYGPSTDQVRTFDDSIEELSRSVHRAGGGDALRVRLAPGVLAKASYEYAVRLPRPDEVFGDGALISPNQGLTPEQSHNGNLGLLADHEFGPSFGGVEGEVSGFYRYTDHMIVQLLAQDRVHSIHQNVFTVRTLGVDGGLRWHSPRRWFALHANGTWQDQRNVSEHGPFAPFEGQRVPNRPWLFANAGAELHLPRIGAPNAVLSLGFDTHYVHSFLPGWQENGELDRSNHIPTQLTHSASLSYSVRERGQWSLDFALDLTNLTDARVYDVLGVQKPGRAAFFKVTLCWACAAPASTLPN